MPIMAIVQVIKDVMPPATAIIYNERRRSMAALPPPLSLRPLPPMMIVEKGESLDEFARRKAPDRITAVQVRLPLAVHAWHWCS